jgi:hypothetical protein
MQKPILASAVALAVLSVGPASAATANYKAPLDARTLSTIKSHFSELMEVASRHDLKALHLMFWQSPSVLLVVGYGLSAVLFVTVWLVPSAVPPPHFLDRLIQLANLRTWPVCSASRAKRGLDRFRSLCSKMLIETKWFSLPDISRAI